MTAQKAALEQKLKVKQDEIHKIKSMGHERDTSFNAQLEELQNRVRKHQTEMQQRENDAKELLERNLVGGTELKKEYALLD